MAVNMQEFRSHHVVFLGSRFQSAQVPYTLGHGRLWIAYSDAGHSRLG
jgi:hypothetical protein